MIHRLETFLTSAQTAHNLKQFWMFSCGMYNVGQRSSAGACVGSKKAYGDLGVEHITDKHLDQRSKVKRKRKRKERKKERKKERERERKKAR